MNLTQKQRIANVLSRAIYDSVTEEEFWQEFDAIAKPDRDGVYQFAWRSATRYWGNFHARNILLIPVKPNRDQVENGKDEFKVLIEGINAGWSHEELLKGLDDV